MPKRGLVDRDRIHALQLAFVGQQLRISLSRSMIPCDRAGRLMLVQSQLEVHAHDGEILAHGRQRQVERAGVARLGSSSNRQKIASGLRKMSAGPTKPAHGPMHAVTAISVLIAAEAPLESDN